jgi:hypothetical protein
MIFLAVNISSTIVDIVRVSLRVRTLVTAMGVKVNWRLT